MGNDFLFEMQKNDELLQMYSSELEEKGRFFSL